MENTHQFDVLVVYSEGVASSASSTNIDTITPFVSNPPKTNYNLAYAYFLSSCKENNLRAAFTTSSEVIESGTCKSYWLYEKNSWIKVNNKCYAPLIFDKFAPINQKRIDDRAFLFASEEVVPFTDKYLLKLFRDKHKTHEELQLFAIPTVIINSSSVKDIVDALTNLQKLKDNHRNIKDFSSDIILKDRSGAGGDQIYKVTSFSVIQIKAIMDDNYLIKFVLQPFVEFEKGFAFKSRQCLTDIRLIYLKDKLVQSYIRMAQKNEFRCNEHKGGTLEYIAIKDVPKSVLEQSRKIIDNLKSKTSLFALDFIVSNNGNVFFLEGNIGPGLDWNLSKKVNERKSKELIRIIVKELVKRSDQTKLGRIKSRIIPSETMHPPLII